MGEVGYQAAFIAVDDVEEIAHTRRKAVDAQLRVEEQDSTVCRGQEILDISMGARNALELAFNSLLTVCSSSLIDCSSSLLVTNSSAVERYSSLTDCSSSFAARNSSFAPSYSSREAKSCDWLNCNSWRSCSMCSSDSSSSIFAEAS